MDTAASVQKRHRSPNYPAFSLKEAIDKIKLVYDKERRSTTTPEVVASHLGYSQGVGGPGGRALSALRQYGLLDDVDGKVRISDAAYAIIHFPEGSLERIQALNSAIRRPALFRELLTEYGESMPSDATLKHNLLKRDFNPSVIDDVVKIFRDTIALDPLKNVEYPAIRTGDYVQWESQGILHFDKPKRISQLSDDGQFAFFDGSNTGIPVSELAKADIPIEEKENGGKLETKRLPPKPGMNSDVFTLEEGEVILQWPSQMSPESYEDFKDWIELMTRKAKRSVKSKEGASEQS